MSPLYVHPTVNLLTVICLGRGIRPVVLKRQWEGIIWASSACKPMRSYLLGNSGGKADTMRSLGLGLLINFEPAAWIHE